MAWIDPVLGPARALADRGASLKSALAGLRRDPSDAEAMAIAGLLTTTGAKLVDAAVALRPDAGWPRAIRALRRWKPEAFESLWKPGAGVPKFDPAVLEDLDAAVEREPSPWILALRATVLEKMGAMPRALADLERAVAAAPGSAALQAQHAHALFFYKRYPDAVAAYTRALALTPAPAYFEGRALAREADGDQAGAAADARAAMDAAPGDAAIKLLWARLAPADAAPRLGSWADDADPRLAAGAEFLRASLDFRAGRYENAAAGFARAEAAARAGNFPGRFCDAGHSAMATAFPLLKGPGPAPADRARVLILGAGMFYPYQASLETLRALKDADVVFSNLAGSESMEFLRLFCDDVRTVSFEGREVERWVAKMLAPAAPGRTIAFITRGHPFLAGPLARTLQVTAAAAGHEIVCLGAISSFDTMLALAADFPPGIGGGVHYYEAQAVVDGTCLIDAQMTSILSLPSEGRTRRRDNAVFCDLLRAAYPEDHVVHAYGPRYETRSLEPVPLRGLADWLGGMDLETAWAILLFVPPAGSIAGGGPAAPKAPEPGAPRVVVAGAGVDCPYQTSLDALKAMRACDVLFTDVPEPEAADFLRRFCPDVRALPAGSSGPEPVLAEAVPGRAVGFVTRGHPFATGTLARRLVREAKASGAQVEAFGAVSSFDTGVSLASERGFVDWDATHHYPHEVLTEHGVPVQTSVPTILTLPSDEATRAERSRRLVSILAKAYGGRHAVFLHGPGLAAGKPVALKLSELGERLAALDAHRAASVYLFVPPRRFLWW